MYEEELTQVTQAVWESMLGIEAVPSEVSDEKTFEIAVRIDIAGDWRGSVYAVCGEALARRLAGILHQRDPSELSEEQWKDAIGEIANMLGGGIKPIFSGSCKLSLPRVVSVSEALKPRTLEASGLVCLDSLGDPFLVKLCETAALEPAVTARS
jgi:chemotaxis protein CheX